MAGLRVRWALNRGVMIRLRSSSTMVRTRPGTRWGGAPLARARTVARTRARLGLICDAAYGEMSGISDMFAAAATALRMRAWSSSSYERLRLMLNSCLTYRPQVP